MGQRARALLGTGRASSFLTWANIPTLGAPRSTLVGADPVATLESLALDTVPPSTVVLTCTFQQSRSDDTLTGVTETMRKQI